MTPADLRATHFARLNAYTRTREYAEWYQTIGGPAPAADLPSLAGQRWEIDEAIYDEFLEMMPPIYAPGGFFTCEETFDGYHARFTREGDRYYCEFARLPRRVNAPEPRP